MDSKRLKKTETRQTERDSFVHSKPDPLRVLKQGGLSAWRPKLACVQIWLLIKTVDFLEGRVSWFGNVEM